MFNNFGVMFASVVFIGIYNCSSVFPNVSRERTVMYRERFAGMYSSWAYSLAQVHIHLKLFNLYNINLYSKNENIKVRPNKKSTSNCV